jgi:methylmalonyl-CoA/ethylmalonyl-CoA epimerase
VSVTDPTAPAPAEVERRLDFFGPGARFHHVGLAVQSIRDALPTGEEPAEATPEASQGVSLSFLDLHGVRLELLEPLDDDSPILGNLRKGVKLLHLCFEVPSLDIALDHGRRAGFHRVGAIKPSAAMHGRRIAWVFSKQLGLVELIEL